MTNLLNSITANQNLKAENKTSFTFDSNGKVKPLQDKAKLLPPKVFGSPIECVKDLKTDVFNIKKALKGQANDYEIGRLNDLGLKAGSVGIASYLYVKNPLRLNKKMEFVGLTTFLGSMMLWPKVMIQAPLKARTGVDFRQEYIDSQGRKKYLYQDPQYVLTDLLPREELDKIGNKMDVDENLSDRDNFIKQRARKAALQANTLWMATAGFAAPVMSALSCNFVERILKTSSENAEFKKTEADAYKPVGENVEAKTKAFDKFLGELIKKEPNAVLSTDHIKTIGDKFGEIFTSSNSGYLTDFFKKDLQILADSSNEINEEFVKKVFGEYDEDGKLYKKVHKTIESPKYSAEKKIEKLVKTYSQSNKLKEELFGKNASEVKEHEMEKSIRNKILINATPTLKSIKTSLVNLYRSLAEYSEKKTNIDGFIFARMGQQNKPNSYIASKWECFGEKFVDALNFDSTFSTTELKKAKNGDEKFIKDKIKQLVKSDKLADSVNTFMKIIDDFNQVVKKCDVTTNGPLDIFKNAREVLVANKFNETAEHLISDKNVGTVYNVYKKGVEDSALSAKASFYRVIQYLGFEKSIEDGSLDKKIENLSQGNNIDKAKIKKACEEILFNSTTVNYIERFKNKPVNLTDKEVKVAMEVLFDTNDTKMLEECLSKDKEFTPEEKQRMLEDYKAHKTETRKYLGNYDNEMRTDFKTRTVADDLDKSIQHSMDGEKKNNLTGKKLTDFIKEAANKKYNSKKWLLFFSGIMAGLTTFTLTAGLFIGRKGKIEKQAEKESKMSIAA